MVGSQIPLYRPPVLRGWHLTQVLASRWLTAGPMCEKLKTALGERFDWAPHKIVLAMSATAGFQAVLDHLYNVDTARCVQIRVDTWPGMHHAIRWAGMCRVNEAGAADICVHTDIGGAEPDQIITRTRPPVSPTYVADISHSWFVRTSSSGYRFQIGSCYPTKLMAAGEGGVVFCERAQDAEALELRLTCGAGVRWGKKCAKAPWAAIEGRKGHMTDVQAALVLEALENFDSYRLKIAKAHAGLAERAELQGISYKEQPVQPYLFQAHCPMHKIVSVQERLEELRLPSAWNFAPADWITLPCYPDMLPAEMGLVLYAYRKACEHAGVEAGSRTLPAEPDDDQSSRGGEDSGDQPAVPVLPDPAREDLGHAHEVGLGAGEEHGGEARPGAEGQAQ